MVSRVSSPVPTSRTHRLWSRMNAARLPSGETTALRRGSGLRTVSAVHRVPRKSHTNRRTPMSNCTDCPASASSSCVNGSVNGSYVESATVDRAAASRAWSNSRPRVRRAGSTITYSNPSAIAFRYQNRPSASQFGRTAPRSTSGLVFDASIVSARA